MEVTVGVILHRLLLVDADADLQLLLGRNITRRASLLEDVTLSSILMTSWGRLLH